MPASFTQITDDDFNPGDRACLMSCGHILPESDARKAMERGECPQCRAIWDHLRMPKP